jgi:hypothetical protein
MNSRTALLVAFAILFLAGICVYQARQSSQERARVAVLNRELENRSQRMQELERSKEESEQPRPEPERGAERPAVRGAGQSLAPAPSTNLANDGSVPPSEGKAQPRANQGGFGELFSKIMQDPEAKKFIRDQQRAMMDQLYAPLIKQLGLSPDEADKFKDLLSENAGKATERARAVLSPEQLAQFGKFQTNQLQTMRMGISMARKFIP